jgi:hypothetical protein
MPGSLGSFPRRRRKSCSPRGWNAREDQARGTGPTLGGAKFVDVSMIVDGKTPKGGLFSFMQGLNLVEQDEISLNWDYYQKRLTLYQIGNDSDLNTVTA